MLNIQWVKGYNAGTSYEWPGYHVTAGGYAMEVRNYGRGLWRVFVGRESTEEERKGGAGYLVRIEQADGKTAAEAKDAGGRLLTEELNRQGIRLEPMRGGGWIQHRTR
jgi:hypothetical protein